MKVLTLAGALIVWAAGMSSAQEPGAKAGVMPQGLADGPYVHVMAAHHEEAIKMANLGATKATNAQVKALAARIAGSRQKELAELKQFMTSVAEDMAPADKRLPKHMPLEKLEQASGPAFDALFVEMMIEHEQDALSLTRSAKLVMTNVQEFARRAAQQQAADVKALQQLRK